MSSPAGLALCALLVGGGGAGLAHTVRNRIAFSLVYGIDNDASKITRRVRHTCERVRDFGPDSFGTIMDIVHGFCGTFSP